MWLPPYSPDLNPIEQVFAKLKSLLRTAGERTVDVLWDRIATILDQLERGEFRAYFRHRGYAA